MFIKAAPVMSLLSNCLQCVLLDLAKHEVRRG